MDDKKILYGHLLEECIDIGGGMMSSTAADSGSGAGDNGIVTSGEEGQGHSIHEDSSIMNNSTISSSNILLSSSISIPFTTLFSQYDCCLVFCVDKLETDGISIFAKRYIRKLVMNGLDIFIYTNGYYNFILIKASLDQLRYTADKLQYKFLLNSNILQKIAENGDEEVGIHPIHIYHDEYQSHLTPYQYIYAKYRLDLPEELYSPHQDFNHPFCSSIRFKLVLAMIVSKPADGSFPIKIRQHITKKNIVAFFPLHDRSKLKKLQDSWLPLGVLPWNAPFYDIKEYFGEKIALYYRFLGFYSLWLLLPAFISFPIQLYLLIIQEFDSPLQVAYAVFMLVWGILVLQFWKRQQSYTALEWGMIDFGLEEVTRPEFKGKIQSSSVTGRKVFYFPPKKRRIYLFQSSLIILTLTFIALGTVVAIYTLRNSLNKLFGFYGQVIISIINSLQITIFNSIYFRIANLLTKRENHRTDTKYENAFVAKYFIFQFVNSYISFYYIAFVAQHMDSDGDTSSTSTGTGATSTSTSHGHGDCGASNCVIPLAINLVVVLGSRILLNNLKELMKARYYHSFLSLFGAPLQAPKRGSQILLPPEEELFKTPYDSINIPLQLYTETAIQFGYVILFVAALPATSIIGLIGILIDVKVDAWTLLNWYQRPVPRGAENIGLWQPIMGILVLCAIVTNAGIISFTMDLFDHQSDTFRLWFFILFQWTLFFIQLLVYYYINPTTPEVRLQQRRSKFLITKIVNKVSDELEEASTGGMNSALMIESEEKSKLTRKQRRIEEQDRREYVVYSFDENQGFYRSPPLNSSVSVSSLETGTSSGTVNPLTNEQKEVHETTQEVELREEQDERRNRNPTNSQDISNQDANSHSPRPPSTQRIVSQSDHPPSHSPSPLPSSAFSKSQSLKVSQNSQKKLPFRSVSLKDFRGKNRNDPAAAGHPTSPAEGEGHRGISNVGYVQDRDGRLSTIQYKKNIIEINNYNEEEKKDEERMMEEDCGLMYVADE